MAKIVMGEKEVEVKNGAGIGEACKELGIMFPCGEGICGACVIEIEEGMKHLSELTQQEKDMGMEGKQRLACQCKIKGGIVKIRY